VSEFRVFVTVGTDHHIFGRLLEWIGRWAVAHPDATVVVQHGYGPLPAGCEGYQSLTMDQMREQISAADAVICSCGPGAVMDARELGRLPIAVPRLARYGEHVDDHQVAFAQHLDQHGIARGAHDEAQLTAVLDEAQQHPERFRIEPAGHGPEPSGIRAVGELVDQLAWRT
jgi:UDP-N-acetylglucosamine transferase subunit ALG13